jgi:hypothetical protein
MPGPTDSLETFTTAIQDIITANQVALGIADIWYGEQHKIPRTPSVEVMPGTKTRILAGAPRRTTNNFQVFVMILVGMVQDVQVNSHQANQMAESIETLLHADPTIGGLVINCLVEQIEFGHATRSMTEYRAARLNVTAESRTNLPMQPGYNQ